MRETRLDEVELFAELTGEQLDWLRTVGRRVELAPDEVLFHDGETAEHFYVLLAGELLITKEFDGREQVLSRHSATAATDPEAGPQPDDKPRAAHQFTGELPLLAGGGYVAKATSVGRSVLLAYDKTAFMDMIVHCPQVCRVLLPVLAWRIRSYEAQAGRRAMLAGLGVLTAGLTHELNNPAAAVVRATGELEAAVRGLTAELLRSGAESASCEYMAGLIGNRKATPLGALEAADASDEIGDWLFDHELPEAAEFADVLAEHGIGTAELTELAGRTPTAELGSAIRALGLCLHAATLVGEAAAAGNRISTLIESAQAYTSLDRAPRLDVDLREGLDATLAMLAPKLACIRVIRSYVDLPLVAAYPSELNQVWTNLIDNAIDAMGGGGTLGISTRREGGCAIVEIHDDGAGIPADVLPKLFQPFFTTKDIGKGTGLGLHLCHNIIANRHNGAIEVTSAPGSTTFIVRLPISGDSC